MLKFVEPNVTIKFPWNYINVDNKYDTFLKQIEECGRICYQSFDKITEKSAFNFVPHVINRKHWSVTEFGTLDIVLNKKLIDEYHLAFKYFLDVSLLHSKIETNEDNVILHTSLREIYKVFLDNCNDNEIEEVLDLFLKSIYLDRSVEKYKENLNLILEDIVSQINDKSKFIEIDPKNYNSEYVRFVSNFVSNLNFTHQLVRHRKPSYLQLSRRYCKILEELILINPKTVYNFTEEEEILWKKNLEMNLILYKNLLKNHKAEVARTVLPTGIMTELIVLEYLPGWEWIWKQRNSLHADVMMRYLMNKQIHILKNLNII